MAQTITELLKSITDLWYDQIKPAEEKKNVDFGASAREVMAYVGKRYKRIGIEPVVDGIPQNPLDKPNYITVANFTQAAIDVLTPYVFAKVPNRLASPRRPQVPPELEDAVPEIIAMQRGIKQEDTMLCFLLQWWLNWCPKIYGLSREGRMVVQEAIAKGRGTLWLEMLDGPTGEIPGSFSDSVDNLLIDPDCKQMRDAGWIVRKRWMHNWKIAEIYDEDLDKIRSRTTSALATSLHIDPDSDRPQDPKKGDMGVFYEFWSVMGFGDKLVMASEDVKKLGPLQQAMDQVGPYVHFAIMPGLDYPLGMEPEKIEAAATNPEQLGTLLKAMLSWPIKTYENPDNPWPVFCLDFKPNIDNPWAKSILEAGLPCQQFIDEIYQGLMNRAKTVSKDIVITSTAMEQAIRDALIGGVPFEIVAQNDSVSKAEIEKLIHVLQFPPMNKDIVTILDIMERLHQKLTGLDPAMFGGIPKSPADRSAKASAMRESGLARRPDDYADTVESWMSAVSAGEATATRLMVDPETVAPNFGEQIQQVGAQPVYGPLTTMWIKLVQTDDPAVAAAECAYTVEAGSGRRRNKQLLQQNAQQLYTMLGQQFYAFGEGTGNMKPYLALVEMVGEAYDMPIEPLIEKFEEAIAQAQVAATRAGPAAPGGGQGGAISGTPGAGAGTEAGGSRIPGAWQKAAGGPRPTAPLTSPPETAQ